MIVKLGGGSAINLSGIVADLAEQQRNGAGPMILVHGANALRDDLAKRLNIPLRTLTSVSGVTSTHSDDEMIDLMMMAYAGLRNKRLVELCQQNGINAIGLSGIDGRLIEGERNSAIRIRENGKTLIVRDNSGKPKAVNTKLLKLLMDAGYTPVLSVPIIDADGKAINTDNDDVVALLHREMTATKILQFIEAPGLLTERSNPGSLVQRIEKETLPSWEEKVEGRMRRKIMGIRRLFESGSPQVIISDGRGEHPLVDALAGRGTTIQ
jgi:acetylglutamate/LysW-gamma-L-alpha-aminoadipate kinase